MHTKKRMVAIPFSLLFLVFFHSAFELINTPAGIYQFLFAGEKWMALRANIN